MYNIQLIAKLAQDVEITDPIDWGELSISETEAYELMSAHVVEILSTQENKLLTAHAIITKLLVENFVLNLRLLEYGK
jgi:hypothetical protein